MISITAVVIVIMPYAKDQSVNLKDYIQSIQKPEYVYRILGDLVGYSISSARYYYLNEELVDQLCLDISKIKKHIDHNPPKSHDEKFIKMLWNHFLNGEEDDINHHSVKWDSIELLEDL